MLGSPPRRQGKCTASPPLTLSSSVKIAKRSEADGAGNLSRLCEATACGLAFTGWRRPNACGKGAGGFPLHPLPRGERGWGSAHGVGKTLWGSRSRGQCAVGTHFKGFGLRGRCPSYKAQGKTRRVISLCSLAWLSGDRWAHVASVAKAAPCALRPLITDNLQARGEPPLGLWRSLSSRSLIEPV